MLTPPALLTYTNAEGQEIVLEVNVFDYDEGRLRASFEVIKPRKGPDFLFEHYKNHWEMYAPEGGSEE